VNTWFILIIAAVVVLLIFLYLHMVYVEVYEIEFSKINISTCNVIGIDWVVDITHDFDKYFIHHNLHDDEINLISLNSCIEFGCLGHCPECRNIKQICHVPINYRVKSLYKGFTFSFFGFSFQIPLFISKQVINISIGNVRIVNIPIIKIQYIADSIRGWVVTEIHWNDTICGDYFSYKPHHYVYTTIGNKTVKFNCLNGKEIISGTYEFSHSKSLIRYVMPIIPKNLLSNDSVCKFICEKILLFFTKCYISCKVEHNAFKVQDRWITYNPFLVIQNPVGKYIVVYVVKPMQILFEGFTKSGIRTVVEIKTPKTIISISKKLVNCLNNTCITISPIKLLEVKKNCSKNEIEILKVIDPHRQKEYRICMKVRYVDFTNKFAYIENPVNYEVKTVEKGVEKLQNTFKIENEETQVVLIPYTTTKDVIARINITTYVQICIFGKCIDIKT